MTPIESLIETYKTSILQKDVASYASIFDEEVRIFDMWMQWSYDGLPAWRQMAEEWFTSLGTDRDMVTFDDIQIQLSGDMAIVTAIVKFTAVSENGKSLRYLQNRLTWAARKKGTAWKIIHQHTSSPIDFGTMKVILQR